MKIKITALMIILVLLAGCSKAKTPEPGETSEIHEVEIEKQRFDTTKVEITPENFMEKMAFLEVEISKVDKSESVGEEAELIYEGVSRKEEGNIFGQLVTHETEDYARGWFEYIRNSYDFIGHEIIEYEDEENRYSVRTETAFIGIILKGKETLIVSAGRNPSLAALVFSCF